LRGEPNFGIGKLNLGKTAQRIKQQIQQQQHQQQKINQNNSQKQEQNNEIPSLVNVIDNTKTNADADVVDLSPETHFYRELVCVCCACLYICLCLFVFLVYCLCFVLGTTSIFGWSLY
jgi:hypothetical protein